MYLHEAITQAGEGGKIRRKGWESKNACWLIGGNYITHSDEDANPSTRWTSELTASDWEIVEEQVIEVGDVVNLPDHIPHCKKAECQVARTNDIRASLFRVTDGLICGCEQLFENLTLIRKGNKHVFEGAEFKIMHSLVVPFFEMGGEEYRALADNGKTYRMTLEEMEDV